MSCVHYQSGYPRGETSCSDTQYPYNSETSVSRTPRSKAFADIYKPECHSKCTISEIRRTATETPVTARGDPAIAVTPEAQLPGFKNRYKYKTVKYGDSIYNSTASIEKLQARLKYLEDGNTIMQTRTHNLITANKGLALHLQEEHSKNMELANKVTVLQEELQQKRKKFEETRENATQTISLIMKGDCGINTDEIPKREKNVQIWAVCKACQKKLENCEKQTPTVTITKDELEALETDMQTLRDAVIAREEVWDKAMEREENYRQQLTRLATEVITARHLSESQEEKLQGMSNTLSEKEQELKVVQKDNLCLNKLIAKLYSHYQRSYQDTQDGNPSVEISDKDLKVLEDIAHRMLNTKTKHKPKSKNPYSDKISQSAYYQGTQQENKIGKNPKS